MPWEIIKAKLDLFSSGNDVNVAVDTDYPPGCEWVNSSELSDYELVHIATIDGDSVGVFKRFVETKDKV